MKEKIPYDIYREIIEKVPIPCIDLIVHDKEKVLLVKRRDHPAQNEWWLPGGAVYKNEKLEEAVLRKAKEELGLDVEIQRKLGVYEFMWDKGMFPDSKTGIHIIVVVFIVKPANKNQKIKLDETSSDFKWIDKIEEDLDSYVKQILKGSKIFD